MNTDDRDSTRRRSWIAASAGLTAAPGRGLLAGLGRRRLAAVVAVGIARRHSKLRERYLGLGLVGAGKDGVVAARHRGLDQIGRDRRLVARAGEHRAEEN